MSRPRGVVTEEQTTVAVVVLVDLADSLVCSVETLAMQPERKLMARLAGFGWTLAIRIPPALQRPCLSGTWTRGQFCQGR